MYRPCLNEGVVGRNYAYQCGGGASAFFDENTILNCFMGAGALGTTMDDFNGDNYNFEKAGYIGGGGISCSNSGGRPIQSHPTPRVHLGGGRSGRRRLSTIMTTLRASTIRER